MAKFAALEAALEWDQSCLQQSRFAYAASGFISDSSSRDSNSEAITVFCDFDGPIVNVSDRYYSTYKLGLAKVQSASQTQGLPIPVHVLSKGQFWQMKQERTPDPEIALRSGLRGEQITLFLQYVSQIVNQVDLLQQDHLQPGVNWALSRFHAQGMRLILVTLRHPSQVMQLLRHYGIAHLFHQIHGAGDDQAAYLNQAEHKTKLLATAMTEAGLSPEIQAGSSQANSQVNSQTSPQANSAWMIGDTEADVLAGQAMNIPTIALTCGIRSQSYLQRFTPTQIHSNLASAAHYLIESRLSKSKSVAA